MLYLLYLLLYIVGWGPGGGIWGLGWSLVVANGIHLDRVICIPKLNTHDKHVLVAASLTLKINVILKVRQVDVCSQIHIFAE